MDCVPKSTRARWKSLDSVGVFGWCGSAALGGYLADLHGYAFTFLITAAVQGVATALQATLVFLVPRSEKREDEGAEPAPELEPTVEPLPATSAVMSSGAAAETSIQ